MYALMSVSAYSSKTSGFETGPRGTHLLSHAPSEEDRLHIISVRLEKETEILFRIRVPTELEETRRANIQRTNLPWVRCELARARGNDEFGVCVSFQEVPPSTLSALRSVPTVHNSVIVTLQRQTSQVVEIVLVLVHRRRIAYRINEMPLMLVVGGHYCVAHCFCRRWSTRQ